MTPFDNSELSNLGHSLSPSSFWSVPVVVNVGWIGPIVITDQSPSASSQTWLSPSWWSWSPGSSGPSLFNTSVRMQSHKCYLSSHKSLSVVIITIVVILIINIIIIMVSILFHMSNLLFSKIHNSSVASRKWVFNGSQNGRHVALNGVKRHTFYGERDHGLGFTMLTSIALWAKLLRKWEIGKFTKITSSPLIFWKLY